MSKVQHDRTAILVHSLGLSAQSWDAVRVAIAGASDIAAIKTVAVDLPGHGAQAGQPFTLEASVDTCVRAVRAAGDRPVQLVGSGLGSLVALAAAAVVNQSISLAVAAFPPIVGAAGRQRADAVRAVLDAHGMDAFAQQYLTDTLRDPAYRPALHAAMTQVAPVDLVAALVAVADWRPAALPATVGRRLVIRGRTDSRVTEAAAEQLAFGLGADLIEIDGGGHLAYVEQPARFAAILAIDRQVTP